MRGITKITTEYSELDVEIFWRAKVCRSIFTLAKPFLAIIVVRVTNHFFARLALDCNAWDYFADVALSLFNYFLWLVLSW